MENNPDTTPLVSILMTAYNRQQFVAEAILSVLASTYQNWELIIVDDGSKDHTVVIAKKYEAQDKRIKVYVNEENLGDYNNRNRAASYAQGVYLKYLDADDLIYPHSLQIMIDSLEKNSEAAMALSQNIIDDYKAYPILVDSFYIAKIHFLKRAIISVGPSASIIRREIFEEFCGFSSKQFAGDTELWMKISFKYPIVLLQPSLVWWRIHEGQQSEIEKKDSNVAIVRYNLNKYYILNMNTPLSMIDRTLAFKKLNRRFITNQLRYIIKGDFSSFLTNLKVSKLKFIEMLSAIFH